MSYTVEVHGLKNRKSAIKTYKAPTGHVLWSQAETKLQALVPGLEIHRSQQDDINCFCRTHVILYELGI